MGQCGGEGRTELGASGQNPRRLNQPRDQGAWQEGRRISKGARRNQEGAFGVQEKGWRERGRGQLGVLLSSERVSNVSLGSWNFSEEWRGVRERRQGVQSHLRMEKGGARARTGTGQTRGGTQVCSDEKADLGGCEGQGNKGAGAALPREGYSKLQQVQRGGTCVCGHKCSSAAKRQLLLWRLYLNSLFCPHYSTVIIPQGASPRSSQLVGANTWLPTGSSQPPVASGLTWD